VIFVIEDDMQYSIASIAMFDSKSGFVAEGDEHSAIFVRHLWRRTAFLTYPAILAGLYY
jgi:hypothetical protein